MMIGNSPRHRSCTRHRHCNLPHTGGLHPLASCLLPVSITHRSSASMINQLLCRVLHRAWNHSAECVSALWRCSRSGTHDGSKYLENPWHARPPTRQGMLPTTASQNSTSALTEHVARRSPGALKSKYMRASTWTLSAEQLGKSPFATAKGIFNAGFLVLMWRNPGVQ